MLSKRYESTDVDFIIWLHLPSGTSVPPAVTLAKVVEMQGRRRRGAAGARAPGLSKVGGHKWVCAPPLLDRRSVLISLFAHIL